MAKPRPGVRSWFEIGEVRVMCLEWPDAPGVVEEFTKFVGDKGKNRFRGHGIRVVPSPTLEATELVPLWAYVVECCGAQNDRRGMALKRYTAEQRAAVVAAFRLGGWHAVRQMVMLELPREKSRDTPGP